MGFLFLFYQPMDLLKILTTKGYILDRIIWSIFANGSLYEDNETHQREVGTYLYQRMLNPIEEICKIMRKQAEKFDKFWSIQETKDYTKITLRVQHSEYPSINYKLIEQITQEDLLKKAKRSDNISPGLFLENHIKKEMLEKFHNDLGTFLLLGENDFMFHTDSRFNWETQDWILDHIVV